MKTILVPLIGDPLENLFQLGKKERQSYLLLEERVTRLLSASQVLRFGHEILSRAKSLFKQKKNTEESFFDQCIKAYAEGLGIEPSAYMSFISLFEVAAHYGQSYPELKGLLPGCTSLFEKSDEGFTHTRLVDFPLLGVFEANPRLYYWKMEGRPAVLNYSCEGMAPLFFQAIHEDGFSLALHHKPGQNYHREGKSIFKITFETLFETPNMNEFRRELRKNISMTKWGYFMLDKEGVVICADIDGPSINFETFNLSEASPLIFTNIPLQKDPSGSESFYLFCEDRQAWLADKLRRRKSTHPLDFMTDVKDHKSKKWLPPVSTLSTVGAIHINLSKGLVHVKEGDGALVASDPIVEFSLSSQHQGSELKAAEERGEFEKAWKMASRAQSAFDQGAWEEAYHELQMAHALMPQSQWKEIFKFYLHVWDFKFITHERELSLIYREVKKIHPPHSIRDQWYFLCMRLEKRLGLVPTVHEIDLTPYLRQRFNQEKDASKTLFNTWMSLLYPRIEILDVFSPHHK